MKTIEICLRVKLVVSDKFDLPLVVRQIEDGVRDGLSRQTDIYQSIENVDIENLSVIPTPNAPNK